MRRAIHIDEVIRAEQAGKTLFLHWDDMTWDEAVLLGERLDMLLSEVGGWAKFIGKSNPGGPGDCLFELYPRGRSANRAWRMVNGIW